MPFPLYRGLNPPAKASPSMNLGLWFERYYSGYDIDWKKVDEEARTTWLKDCARNIDANSRLKDNALHLRLLATHRQGQARVFKTKSHFVTGLGNAHPLENGFLWHPTLGMPYLPGSAVKGLVRALVETAYEGENKDALLKRWFGTTEKGDVAEHCGQFIFMDALPVAPCDLHVEVMTPHMGKWYAKGGSDPLKSESQPGDWHAPIPVQYLVARNLSLQFIILPRPGACPGELESIWSALESALDWLGAGAKTAIGFGSFALDEEEERKLQKRAEELRAQVLEQSARVNASEQGLIVLNLQKAFENLPANCRPGTGPYEGIMKAINDAIEAMLAIGAPEDRAALHQAISDGMRNRGVRPSSNREREFRQNVRRLLPA